MIEFLEDDIKRKENERLQQEKEKENSIVKNKRYEEFSKLFHIDSSLNRFKAKRYFLHYCDDESKKDLFSITTNQNMRMIEYFVNNDTNNPILQSELD